MDPIDAIILAAGRLRDADAASAGVKIKALLRVGESTPLDAIVGAMRASRSVSRVIVVAPSELHGSSSQVDLWIDERMSGEDNVLAGLGSASTRRSIVSASDLPFVQAAHIDDFLDRVPDDADFAYPIYAREEFLAAFPQGRAQFARLADAHYTGGSLCLMNVEIGLRNAVLIRRAFAARKSQLAMASLLGLAGLVSYTRRRLRIEHVERRLGELTAGRAVAIRGAHPALAMDCDSALDIDYVRRRQALVSRP